MVSRTNGVTWAFDPREGSVHCAAYVTNPLEFDFIRKRGFVVVDNQPADLLDDGNVNHCDPASGFMRFQFREPYHRIRMIEVAA